MEELATVLRRERWLVSLLVFRLTEMHHLLAANDTRFLGWASAEVEDALDRVREAELMRSVLAGGTTDDTEVPEPYGEILADHRRALDEMVGEVHALRETNRRLASAAIDAFGETDDLELQLAEAGYYAVLAATEQLRLPSLTEFVR